MLRAKYMTSAKGPIVTVGVTGASGAILAQKEPESLVADGRVTSVPWVVTETGQRRLAERLGVSSGDLLDRLA